MYVEEVFADLFSDKFGEEEVLKGSYKYYNTDRGFGVRKDTVGGGVEFIAGNDLDVNISPEDEMQLLAKICDPFRPDIELPKSKGYWDYVDENKKSKVQLLASQLSMPVIFILLFLIIVLLRH